MPSSGVQTCARSEEHTSELQPPDNLVCRLLLEKKKLHGDHPSLSVRGSGPGHAGEGRGCAIAEGTSMTGGDATWSDGRTGGMVTLFFFNDTATPEISTLSLPDALPI